MPFTYHPPTGRPCEVCEQLHATDTVEPIIDTHDGKASSANNFPFHNWYNFVLGYSPEFPEYMLKREIITSDMLVVDPFMGTGTTLVVCKAAGRPSKGVDANDFMVDTARVKLDWDVDLSALKDYRDKLLHRIEFIFGQYQWRDTDDNAFYQLPLFASPSEAGKDYRPLVRARRPKLLLPKYISDKPLARALLIQDAIEELLGNHPLRGLFDLALDAIIVPISNVRYGPGFGVEKSKDDVDVLSIYAAKINQMIVDLSGVTERQRQTPAEVILGDTRRLTNYLASNSTDIMITSPPYPGDHEYTKHTRLELLYRGYARDHQELKRIKKRMLRASTTNIYRDDNDRETVADLESIKRDTALIQQRLDADGASSGFEKLYVKLVWEYFGGMHKSLAECYQVLKPGGKIALLVSDSHAFKMVHIQTAAILQEIGERIGFVDPQIVLWQLKTSTSHKYYFRENILVLTKPA